LESRRLLSTKVQIDTKHLIVLGRKYYQFTAVDTKTRLAFSRVYTRITSNTARDFLERVINHFPFKIKVVQADNSSEYLKYFHQECLKRRIIHYFSRVKRPNDNALAERLIQTTKYELWFFDERLIPELNYLNQKLSWWLGRYNSYRPHQSLNYITPQEYYQQFLLKQQQNSQSLSVEQNNNLERRPACAGKKVPTM